MPFCGSIIAKTESCKLKQIAEEILENTIYPIDESIKDGLKKELDEQLNLYLQATKFYILIMNLSKDYYDDLSLATQSMFDEFKEIEVVETRK